MSTFIRSPLEQFEIIAFPVLSIYFTNNTLLLLLMLTFFVIFNTVLKNQMNSSLFLIPNRWQNLLENSFNIVIQMVFDSINEVKGQYFFPIVFITFINVILLNLVGLIPSSFTITSHFIYTLCLSISLFIGINIICIKLHSVKSLSLFLPQNTSIFLAFLLVPIEIVSYIFKPISLAIRLFANMMGGHTLLKVIAGFGYTLMCYTGITVNLHMVPSLILIPLFGLELAVSLIQSLVFCILLCIYIGDGIDLH